MRVRSKRLSILGIAIVVLVLVDLETGAFDAMRSSPRSNEANTVASANAYTAVATILVQNNCFAQLPGLYSYSGMTITNKAGIDSLAYQVIENSDPLAFVTHTPTAGTLNIGVSQTITMTISTLAHACHTSFPHDHTIVYTVVSEAPSAGIGAGGGGTRPIYRANVTNVEVTVQYVNLPP